MWRVFRRFCRVVSLRLFFGTYTLKGSFGSLVRVILNVTLDLQAKTYVLVRLCSQFTDLGQLTPFYAGYLINTVFLLVFQWFLCGFSDVLTKLPKKNATKRHRDTDSRGFLESGGVLG